MRSEVKWPPDRYHSYSAAGKVQQKVHLDDFLDIIYCGKIDAMFPISSSSVIMNACRRLRGVWNHFEYW